MQKNKNKIKKSEHNFARGFVSLAHITRIFAIDSLFLQVLISFKGDYTSEYFLTP